LKTAFSQSCLTKYDESFHADLINIPCENRFYRPAPEVARESLRKIRSFCMCHCRMVSCLSKTERKFNICMTFRAVKAST
jgi:hypothetical protein